jgi:hypothetical protein
VEAVLRIRLFDMLQQDYIAWFYEKSGIFTVRSAYHLSVTSELGPDQSRRDEGSSTNADGHRNLYSEIWLAQGPQKVRIFAWTLSQEGLETQENRRR